MTRRELELIREAFDAGMEAEWSRVKPEAQRSRSDFKRAFEFGLKVGEERGRGLAKRKPLKDQS